MKKLFAVFICALLAVWGSITASAADITYTLNEQNYTDWQGTPLTHIANRGDYFCLSDPNGSAYIELDTEDMTSLFIMFDAGYYDKKGTTAVTLEILGEGGEKQYEHNMLVPDNGFFMRTYCGSDEMYLELPDSSEKIRLRIYDGRAYFRNLSIKLSNTHAYSSYTDDPADGWYFTTEALDRVEINTTALDYWIMVGFICAVALIMMIVAKVRQKYKRK